MSPTRAASPGVFAATPAWGVYVPLAIVVAALVALVVAPLLIGERARELRNEMIEVHRPLTSRVADLERATASELSGARGWALTGDPFFVDRFLAVHAYANRLAAEIDSLAAKIGGDVEAAVGELIQTREYWAHANFGRTRGDFREGITEHQRHYEAVMQASQQLRDAVEREVDHQTARIARAEQTRGWVTALLALVALMGAASAIWLASRLLRKERELELIAAKLREANETLEERVRERTRRLRELSRDLTLAEQRERRQLAQLLHDELQQLLFALQLNLSTLQTGGARLTEEFRQAQLDDSLGAIAEALAVTRRLTVDLSPPIQAGESLMDVLDWLTAHVRERFGLEVELRAVGTPRPVRDDLRILLFQTVRELLFNVVKHAEADAAVVEVSNVDGHLAVEVADRGRGFDTEKLEGARLSTVGGLGLRGARERIGLFGGRIEIESEPGGGTRARIVVPVE